MNWFQYQFRLRKLQRDKERLSATHLAAYERAKRANADDNSLQALEAEELFEIAHIDEAIKDLQSRFTVTEAEKLLLPLPEIDHRVKKIGVPETWEPSEISGGFRLSMHGCAKLRSDIRRERKERRDVWQSHLSAWTGIGGIIVAILALLSKK